MLDLPDDEGPPPLSLSTGGLSSVFFPLPLPLLLSLSFLLGDRALLLSGEELFLRDLSGDLGKPDVRSVVRLRMSEDLDLVQLSVVLDRWSLSGNVIDGDRVSRGFLSLPGVAGLLPLWAILVVLCDCYYFMVPGNIEKKYYNTSVTFIAYHQCRIQRMCL